MSDLQSDLDELKADEFPAIDFDYQLEDNGDTIHIYHLEVQEQVRGIGIASTTLTDIESIARLYNVDRITARIGLTNPDSDDTDPTVEFLQSHDFVVDDPTDGGVDVQKSLS